MDWGLRFCPSCSGKTSGKCSMRLTAQENDIRGWNCWTTVTNADGHVLASSQPIEFKSFAVLPADILSRFATSRGISLDQEQETAYAWRELVYQDRPVGNIYASIGISALNRERSEVLLTLIVT